MKVDSINSTGYKYFGNSFSVIKKKNDINFGVRGDIVELGNMGAKYSKVNQRFNIDKVENSIRKSVQTLPNSLIIFVNMPVDYAKTKTSAGNFASSCMEFAPIFYKRINLSDDSKQFREVYSPEIDMIKNMLRICDAYLNHKFQQRDFDEHIEDILSMYVEKLPIKRSTFFIN